jgi:hypothetical protein
LILFDDGFKHVSGSENMAFFLVPTYNKTLPSFQMSGTLTKIKSFRMNIVFYFQCNINYFFLIVPLCTLLPKHYLYFAFMILEKISMVNKDTLVK